MKFYSDSSKRIFELFMVLLEKVRNGERDDIIKKTIELNSTLCNAFSGTVKHGTGDTFTIKDCKNNKEFKLIVQSYGYAGIQYVEKNVAFKISTTPLSTIYDRDSVRVDKLLAEAFFGSTFNLLYDLGLFPFSTKYFTLFTCEHGADIQQKYYSVVESIPRTMNDVTVLKNRVVFKSLIEQFIASYYISHKNMGFSHTRFDDSTFVLDQQISYMNIKPVLSKQESCAAMLVQIATNEYVLLDIYKYMLKYSEFGNGIVELRKAKNNIICDKRTTITTGDVKHNTMKTILQFLAYMIQKLGYAYGYTTDDLYTTEGNISLDYVYLVCEQLFDLDVNRASMLKAMIKKIQTTNMQFQKDFRIIETSKKDDCESIINVLLDTWKADSVYMKQTCSITTHFNESYIEDVVVHMNKSSPYVSIKIFDTSKHFVLFNEPSPEISSNVFVYKFAKAFCNTINCKDMCDVAKTELSLYRPSNILPTMLDADIDSVKTNLTNMRSISTSLLNLERSINLFSGIHYTTVKLQMGAVMNTCLSMKDITSMSSKQNVLFVPVSNIWTSGSISINPITQAIDAYYVTLASPNRSNILSGDELLKQKYIEQIVVEKEEEREMSFQHLPEKIVNRCTFRLGKDVKSLTKLGKFIIYACINNYKLFYSIIPTKYQKRNVLYAIRLTDGHIIYVSSTGIANDNLFLSRLNAHFDHRIQDLILLDNEGVMFGNLDGVKFVTSEYPWPYKDRFFCLSYHVDDYSDDSYEAKKLLTNWYLSKSSTTTVDTEVLQYAQNVHVTRGFRDIENFTLMDEISKFSCPKFFENIDNMITFCRLKFTPSVMTHLNDRFNVIRSFNGKSLDDIKTRTKSCLISWYDVHKYIYTTLFKMSRMVRTHCDALGFEYVPCECMEAIRNVHTDIMYFEYYTCKILFLMDKISLDDYNKCLSHMLEKIPDVKAVEISSDSISAIKYLLELKDHIQCAATFNGKNKMSILAIAYSSTLKFSRLKNVYASVANEMNIVGTAINAYRKKTIALKFPFEISLESNDIAKTYCRIAKEQVNDIAYKTMLGENLQLPAGNISEIKSLEEMYWALLHIVNYIAVKYYNDNNRQLMFDDTDHRNLLKGTLNCYTVATDDPLLILANMQKMYNFDLENIKTSLVDFSCTKSNIKHTAQICEIKKLPMKKNAVYRTKDIVIV